MNTENASPCSTPKTSYLYAWNFRDKTAWFVDMDREDFYRSSFLDQRISSKSPSVKTQLIDSYIKQLDDKDIGSPTFIFHTAFCCSTLLARSLDVPGRTSVFREPLTLLQLADLKRGLSQSDHSYTLLLRRTLQSLSLTSSSEKEKVLIKPTNLANNLLPDLFSILPSAKFLLLHDDLEPFMISVLKRPEESSLGIQHFLNRFLLDNSMDTESLRAQTNGKLHYQAALAWALQKQYLNSVLVDESASIRTIETPGLLSEPESAMASISEWLGLDIEADSFSDILTSQLWNRNAKHPGKPYGPEQRAREQKNFRLKFTPSINDARHWLTHEIQLMPEPFPEQLKLQTKRR